VVFPAPFGSKEGAHFSRADFERNVRQRGNSCPASLRRYTFVTSLNSCRSVIIRCSGFFGSGQFPAASPIARPSPCPFPYVTFHDSSFESIHKHAWKSFTEVCIWRWTCDWRCGWNDPEPKKPGAADDDAAIEFKEVTKVYRAGSLDKRFPR